MKSPDMAGWVIRNPVTLARMKPPKPYSSDSTKSLSDDEIRKLIQVVQARSDDIGLRDFALLVFYLLTGMRRSEVGNLTWSDVKIDEGMVITYRAKGGDIVTREINEPIVRETLLNYLRDSGRLDGMLPETSLWTRHDRAGKPGGKLSSHSISKAFKKYALDAGIENFHLHMIRHSYARILADITGSIRIVQDELGHSSQNVTRIYLQRIGVKKDHFSSIITERFL
jgi:integrase